MTDAPALPTPLVSTAWLAGALGTPGLVVVDASWYLPQQARDPAAEFLAGHVPGARFFDLDACSDPSTDLPHMLPPPALFAETMDALGIDRDARVVVYDGSGVQLSAPRLWWMLRVFGHDRVAVLDGGLVAWQREGRRLESGPADPPAGAGFVPAFRPELVRSRAQLEGELGAGAAQVGDARSAGRFQGTAPEPRPGLKGGHLPGSCNLPFTDLIDPATGLYFAPVELRRRIEAAGLSLERPTIALCGSGVTACSLALGMELAGAGPVAIYDGSWAEWGRDGVVETG